MRRVSRASSRARVRASESAAEEEEEAREDSWTASTASRRRSDDGDGEGSRKSMGSRTASMLGSLSLRAETIDPNVPSVLQKLQNGATSPSPMLAASSRGRDWCR